MARHPDTLEQWMRRESNAGRWGPDDELGTLNLVTAERRREDRIELLGGEISLCIGDGHLHEIPVITYDMSRSGMAVVCNTELASGTSVALRGEGVGSGTLRATVKWCRRVDDGVYKAGLLYC